VALARTRGQPPVPPKHVAISRESAVMKLIHQDFVDHALPSAEFDDDRPIGRLATLN
jgi:hypothetical protein